MTTQAQRSARAALDAARGAVERLDVTRGAEDLAADLIDVWSAVEAALHSLVGNSALNGQALIRDARARQLITFDQANALAELEAVDERLQDTAYQPTSSDVDAARAAYDKLAAALAGDNTVDARGAAPGAGPMSSAPPAPEVKTLPQRPETDLSTMTRVATPRRRLPAWGWIIAAAVVIAAFAVAAYFTFRKPASDALAQGVAAYRQGQREAAVSAFNRAVRENPRDPLPHVYLARMAREVGNFPLASQELQLALQDDPSSAVALREMGANLLAQNNYELARRFYVRAVQADTSDKTAEGYLGCTLAKLGRADEATRWFQRAGEGPWTNCTAPAPGKP